MARHTSCTGHHLVKHKTQLPASNLTQQFLQGQKHPAEALLAPADPNEEDQSQRRPNRRGAADASGSDQASRGRGAAVGGRGGRGGRGYSQEGAGSQEQPRGRNAAGGAGGSAKASRSKAAWVLFTADSRSVSS